jgi:hypothetical protein
VESGGRLREPVRITLDFKHEILMFLYVKRRDYDGDAASYTLLCSDLRPED